MKIECHTSKHHAQQFVNAAVLLARQQPSACSVALGCTKMLRPGKRGKAALKIRHGSSFLLLSEHRRTAVQATAERNVHLRANLN